MKLSVPAFALLLAAGACAGDRHKVDVDPESDDGILLQRIQQEPTVPRKLALLEKFASQYPKATSIAWVYEQLLPIYAESNQPDKVLSTAERLLAIDPRDLDSAHYALKVAEAKNDNDLIRKYAAITWDLASQALQTKKPADPDDVPDWTKLIAFSKQLMSYSEYLLAQQITHETDPAKKATLVQTLEARNAGSQYLAVAKAPPARMTLTQLSPEQAYALAERGLPNDPDNEDYLLAIAEHLLNRESDLPRVLSLSLRVLELMSRKPKPDRLSSEEWERKKTMYVGASNWMAGIIYGKQARYGLSDRYLRTSLPYIRDNPQALAAAYFYLGYDNYAMAGELHDRGRAVDAVRYSKLCVAIDSQFQSLAYKNLQALRNDYNVE